MTDDEYEQDIVRICTVCGCGEVFVKRAAVNVCFVFERRDDPNPFGFFTCAEHSKADIAIAHAEGSPEAKVMFRQMATFAADLQMIFDAGAAARMLAEAGDL